MISFCVFHIFLEAPYVIEIIYRLAGYSRPRSKAYLSLGQLSILPVPLNFLCFPVVSLSCPGFEALGQ